MSTKFLYKAISFTFCLYFTSNIINAQLCPGGGTNYSGVVMFSPSWISGCTTGTSCNGGVEFDNRASCEPTDAIDACAPAPSTACAPNTNGSDIWFKFYASTTTASINVIQNVSFYATAQVFSNSTSNCSDLVQIACLKAGGPSQGITVNLTGLTAGGLYYFRIFGNANNASQRTGTFCFCGSTGLTDQTLAVTIKSFKANTNGNSISLKWITAEESDINYYEVEKSIDGKNFKMLEKINPKSISGIENEYATTDNNVFYGKNYYRLKTVNKNGGYEYSNIVSSETKSGKKLIAAPNPAKEYLSIESAVEQDVVVFNLQGKILETIKLKEGQNILQLDEYINGLYFMRNVLTNEVVKFNVAK